MNEKIASQEVTEKIELKMLTADNASDYFKLIDDNRRYFGNFNNLDQDKYQSVQEVENSLKSADKIRYGVYQGDNLVGTINLQNIAEQEGGVEIGYLVAEKYIGRNIATRALMKLMRYAKNNFRYLVADAHVDNIASQRVLEKAGFKKVSKQGNKYYFRKDL